MFQSTPVIANGRIAVSRGPCEGCDFLFQSTPVIANGRIGQERDVAPLSAGFNPRPLLLTGESILFRSLSVPLSVSIHARYC